jgi:Helix-turn-helix domain
MPYRLRMSAEIGDWIAELCSSAPGSPESLTATEVGAALAAAMSAAELPDLALISDLAAPAADPVDDGDLRAGVDYMYQRLLEELQRVRREVAMAASFRTTTRHRITPQGSEPKPFTATEIAAFEKRERALTKRARHWQAAVDRFRNMKEVTKARITAADGGRQIQLAFLASASSAGGDPAEIEQARADLATAEASLLAANAQAVAVLAEARRLLRAIRRDVTAADAGAGDSSQDAGPGAVSADAVDDAAADDTAVSETADDDTSDDDKADDAGVAAGLLELSADPLGSDVRILCAVQPPGTLMLLAVLEGADAIDAHREEAIRLAGDLLAEIQAEDVPHDDPAADASDTATGELTFAETAPFLARYFPDSHGVVERLAASLAAGTTLRALRRRQGLSLDDLHTRTGMQAQKLWEMETGGLRSARLSEVAAYLRALGSELTVQTDDGILLLG